MNLSLPTLFLRRSASGGPEHGDVPSAARGIRRWRSRLRARNLAHALGGAAVPSGVWAVHEAGVLSWPVTAVGAVAGGAVIVLLCGRCARGDTAKLAAEQAVLREQAERTAAEGAVLKEQAERLQDALEDAYACASRYGILLTEGRASLYAVLGRAAPGPLAPGERDPFRVVGQALPEVLRDAVGAVAQLGRDTAWSREAQVVGSVAPRMHLTISQLLEVLEELEHTIEDPTLLRTTFQAELFATLARRYCESLMVLGGKPFGASREPVALGTVTRQAAAETMHHRRARITGPLDRDLWLVKYAGPAVTHLLSALIDNALHFSPPEKEVEVRVTRRPDGLLIEIEDQGLAMGPEALAAANGLLADPDPQRVLERLRDGRIGLAVAARLAAAHRITVHLRVKTEPEQGIIATVLLPDRLLLTGTQLPTADRSTADRPPHPPPRPGARRPVVSATPPADGDDRSGLPRRTPQPPTHAAADPGATQPAPAPTPGTDAEAASGVAAEAGGGRPRLPRRTRNAPGPAGLEHDRSGPAGGTSPGPSPGRRGRLPHRRPHPHTHRNR
ncbi:ATP-binding protein [Streptomyces clavuligerus]|uniref:ATP-binding protein n=1 Tax=Streptomyces clavuligerus TaxID=1901 RepID=UPI00020D941B|nr:ATP-binding protein [Streptomyces clavuligerus]